MPSAWHNRFLQCCSVPAAGRCSSLPHLTKITPNFLTHLPLPPPSWVLRSPKPLSISARGLDGSHTVCVRVKRKSLLQYGYSIYISSWLRRSQLSPPLTSGQGGSQRLLPPGPGMEDAPARSPWGRRGVAAHILTPHREENRDPCHGPPPPAHRDDAGSLLSGLSLLEDFGFSKMNLLRRSVSELAWAPAYASPGDEAEGGLVRGTHTRSRGRRSGEASGKDGDTHQHSWRTRPCSGSR